MQIHTLKQSTPAGAVPVMKSYDMEGNLILTVQKRAHPGPRAYNMIGKIDSLVDVHVYERNCLLEAAGIACCVH